MRLFHGVFRTILLLAIVGVGTGTACIPVPGSGDAPEGNPVGSTTNAGETVLTLTRGPALGWCPDANMLLSATVTRGDDGRFVLTGSTAIESADPAAECTFPESRFVTGCFVSVPFDEVTLTPQDAADLERLLADLPPRDCSGDEGVCDPCRVTEFIFDDRQEKLCCQLATEYYRMFSGIETLLDAIAAEE